MTDDERIELFTIVAHRTKILRKRMATRRVLSLRIDADKHRIRKMLNELGYHGRMPWEPLSEATAVIVPFPAVQNEQSTQA